MKKIILSTFLLVTTVVFSQNHELGKVTIDELKEKVCPTDTSAAAVVLFKKGKTSFEYSEEGFNIITEIEAKIKIYKKEGLDFANQSIMFFVGDNPKEQVSFSKAVTYNLNNNTIEKTKLKSDGEFEIKASKYNSIKKIVLPNVREGSIIEYKCEIKSPYISNFPEWKFQSSIPTAYSEYTTYIPEYYTYNPLIKGYLTPVITKGVSKRSATFFDRDRNQAINSRTVLNTSQTVEFDEKKTTYVLQNIPALKEESYVNNIDNYTSTVIHELSSKQFPGVAYKSYASSWEAVAKTINDNESFGGELDKKSYFEDDLNTLINGVVVNSERLNIIFNFVKSRMNWNDYRSIYCDDGVKNAYKNKVGNSAEINLILIAMLRGAGIIANPVLVSTRDNGIPVFPSRTAFNTVIAGVEIDNQLVLLDATNKFSQPNVLPISDLNWLGRLIKKDGTSLEIDLMPQSNSRDILNVIGSINDKGEVSGKIRDQYFDYNAFLFRQKNNSLSKDSYVEKLEKKHLGLEINDYDVQNSNDLSKPIVENYSFKSTNAIEIIGDKMYFSPLLYFATTENPFKQETREYPVDFVFPNEGKYNVSLTIPEGYAVEMLPQPQAMTMPGGLGNFKYVISANGSQIQLVYILDINQAIIGSENYDLLKNFFKEVVNKETEKVVIKKV